MRSDRAPVPPTLKRLRRIGEWTSSPADRRSGDGVGSMSREIQSLQTSNAGNVVEPLYIVLQDSTDNGAVVMHPDPAVTTTDAWQEWSIALTDFPGVNMKSFKKMSIGVGDGASTEAGGSNVLYVEDIERPAR